MKHIRVDNNTRLEAIKPSMAKIIFETIDRDRDYLRNWLPFIDSSKQASDTEAFIISVTKKSNTRDIIYSIWYKEEFAGLIGFKDTDWINRKTEIGYWLAEKMQGKGIITSCTEILVKHAFRKLKLNRIQIKVAEKNTRSLSIPKKLGFVFEGIERAGERHNNQFLNLETYSLLKEDKM